jgi:hypothetical protein
MDKKKIGQIGIVLVLLLVGGYFAYGALFGAEETEESDGNATEAGQEILAMLQDLQNIELDGALFSAQAFQSLEDPSVEVENQPQGRPDPFAPIGEDDLSALEGLQESEESEESDASNEGNDATTTDNTESEDPNAPDTSVSNTENQNENTTENSSGSETDTSTTETSAETESSGSGSFGGSPGPPPPPATPEN